VEAYLAEGKLYEAQQMFHMRFNRAASAGRFADAARVMEEGTVLMLEHKQDHAGGELARKLVECWREGGVTPGQEQLDTAQRVFSLFTPGAVEQASAFMRDAIAWSADAGKHRHGEPRLHLLLAVRLSEAGQHDRAQRHWLRSEHPQEHAAALARWCEEGGYAGERDLFVARAVLQYLALENVRSANLVLQHYEAAVPDRAALDTPLANFCRFLLKTVEREALPLFEMLRSKYAPALRRDPALAGYLDKVGHVYFGLEPPKGMLDELLSFASAPQ
jgi:hypothetical protein